MKRGYTFNMRYIIALAILIFIVGCSNKHYTKPGHTSKAIHKATMRKYTINGKTYYPTYVKVGDSMSGVASWYGADFHGGRTSNGEKYNMYANTAAHKTWPMDTMVRVKNLENGKSVIVRINDRGPFVRGRVIDCSYSACKALGFDKKGTAKVKLTVVGFAGKIYKPKSSNSNQKPPSIKLSNFGVQVGAFRFKEGAKSYKEHYSNLVKPPRYVMIRKPKDGDRDSLYRVWVMGFGSKDEAQDFIDENSIDGGFIIRP